MRKFFTLLMLLGASGWALAGGSTINTSIPAPNSLISSAPIRSNFAAAYSDINTLFGQSNGALPPVSPILGQLWLNTSGTPYALEEWDGNQWVVQAYMNASAHTWSTPTASLPLGTSVNNPGTNTLEFVLPVQSISQTSYIFSASDLFKNTRRSNSGVAMTDTLPASTTAGMSNGARLEILNADSAASLTLTAGSGTAFSTGATFVVPPGRFTSWTYDSASAIWRGVDNTTVSLLMSSPSNAATASQLFGGSSIAGQALPVSIGTCLGLTGGVLSNTCDGTVTGPGTTVIGYIPSWNNTTGTLLGAGIPFGTTGSSTLLETSAGGLISPSVIPAPTSSTFGGVESYSAPTNQFLTGINTSGMPLSAQPSFSNLSGSAACSQLPALTGSVVGTAGSCATTLNNSGVTAGSYSSANITVGADGRVTSATNGAGGGYPSNFLVKTSGYTAGVGDNVLADTSGGGFTITLPASPSQFNQVCFHDAAGAFGSGTLTIAGNGSNIMGSSANLTATTPYISFCLIYYTSSTGWRIE